MDIDWNFVKNFSPDEFPEDPDKYADVETIYALQTIRNVLKKPIYPSPEDGALARFDAEDESSQHYCNLSQGIYSKACDWFTDAWPNETFICLISLRSKYIFNAFGIYLDTYLWGKHWPMFHTDTRAPDGLPLMWFRDEGHYYYIEDRRDFSLLITILKEATLIHVNKNK